MSSLIQAKSFLRSVGWMTIVAGGMILLASAYFNKVFFGLGILVALLWSFINLYFLAHVLRELLDRGSDRRGLPFLLFVKFPLLYAAGFWIVWKGYFPIEGIFIGLTLFLGVLFVGALRFKG